MPATNPINLLTGGTQAIRALVLDQFGNVITQCATITVPTGDGTVVAISDSNGLQTGWLYTAPNAAGTYTLTASEGGLSSVATSVCVAAVSNATGHWSIPMFDTIDGTISSTIGSYSSTRAWATPQWNWAGQPGDAVDFRLSGTMSMTATWVADDPDTVSTPPAQTYFGIGTSAEWTNEPDGDTWPFTISVSGAGTDIEPFPGYAIPYWQMTQKSDVELVDTSSGSVTFTSDTLSATVSGTCFGTPGLVPPEMTGTLGAFQYGAGVIPTPSVLVTNPTASEMLTTGASITLQGTADATMGTLILATVQFNVDGTAVGAPVDFDPAHPNQTYSVAWTVTAGAHMFSATATYSIGSGQTIAVTSPTLTAYAASLTVPNVTDWKPKNKDGAVWIGNDFYAPLTATLTSGLDSDGSGATYATYSWSVIGTWMSPNNDTADSTDPTDFPAIPYAECDNPASPGWAEAGSGIGTGTDAVNFDGSFDLAGYYIIEAQCIATIYDSATGAVIGTVSGTGYIGGAASDVPALAGHALRAHAAALTKPIWVNGPSVSLQLVSANATGGWTDTAGNLIDWGAGNSFSITDGAGWADADGVLFLDPWDTIAGYGSEEFVFKLPRVLPPGFRWSMDYVIFVQGSGDNALLTVQGAGLNANKVRAIRKTVQGRMALNKVAGGYAYFDTPVVKLNAKQDEATGWDAKLSITFNYAQSH